MIIPAILENDIQNFTDKLNTLASVKGIKKIQVDFCDGVFVSESSLSIEEIGELPNKILYEAHLMIDNPQNFEVYKSKGFSEIIVHYESFTTEVLLEGALEKIKSLGMKAGIAIKPSTVVSQLRYFADNVEKFLLLGVDPGKQGQSMLPETTDRLAELVEICLAEVIAEVDGGINEDNIKILYDLGAKELVVGSALWNGGQENVGKKYQTLNKIDEA